MDVTFTCRFMERFLDEIFGLNLPLHSLLGVQLLSLIHLSLLLIKVDGGVGSHLLIKK